MKIAKYFIKDKQNLQKLQCSFCYEVNYELLKCTGSCEKLFCKTCSKSFNYSRSCPYCHSTFKPEYLPVKEVQFLCPSLNQNCQAVPKSELEFDYHCRECPYLDKSVKEYYEYKTTFRCRKGHQLRFPLNKTYCCECQSYHYSSTCIPCGNQKYCTECRKLPCSKRECPMGHELKEFRDQGSIVCDLCAISIGRIASNKVYSDRQCNFDVCEACHRKLPDEHPNPNYRNTRPQSQKSSQDQLCVE